MCVYVCRHAWTRESEELRQFVCACIRVCVHPSVSLSLSARACVARVLASSLVTRTHPVKVSFSRFIISSCFASFLFPLLALLSSFSPPVCVPLQSAHPLSYPLTDSLVFPTKGSEGERRGRERGEKLNHSLMLHISRCASSRDPSSLEKQAPHLASTRESEREGERSRDCARESCLNAC